MNAAVLHRRGHRWQFRAACARFAWIAFSFIPVLAGFFVLLTRKKDEPPSCLLVKKSGHSTSGMVAQN
jgi:membrane glycosyltransferase